MKFNENQTLAIQTTGTNVTVFASAGAGKTTLLIERLIKRMRDDRLSIQEICAMTFTEAAASEMRKRLAQALSSQADPYLQAQLPLLPSAHISTIHSFCLAIIKDHGYRLGLDPTAVSNIITDQQQRALSQEAMEYTLQSFASLQPNDFELLTETFSSRPDHDQALMDSIKDVASALNAHPEPEAFIQETLSYYQATSFASWPTAIQEAYWDYHHIRINHLYQSSIQLANAYDQAGLDQPQEWGTITHLIEGFKSTQTFIDNCDLAFRDHFFNTIDVSYKSLRQTGDYGPLRSAFIKEIDDYIAHFYSIPQQLKQLNETYPIIQLLFSISQQYTQHYQSLKRQQAALDFDDLEHLALDLLQIDQGVVAKQLRTQFKEVMVDEYQDTNPIQDRIIHLISSGDNTFRVGDVKQSIYGFRGAKPSLMRSLLTVDDTESFNIFLGHNYRSTYDIVHFNNLLFGRLMNIDTFKDKYSENDFVTTGTESQRDASQPVEIHELMIEDSDLNSHQAKALHIANQMIEYHQQGFKWRDMVVLVRSHATKFELKYAFDQAHIPYFIDERTGFYHADIVQDILVIMKLSLYPKDEYILIQVLASLYYQLSDEALAKLRLHQSNHLYTAFQETYPELADELNVLLNELKKMTLPEAMIALIDFRQIYHEKLTLQQKTNVDLLHEKALQFVRRLEIGIPQFIEAIESLDDQESAQAIPVSSEDDVVSVLTIHQSKGLQYPLVFFWSNDTKRNLDLISPVVVDLSMGVALNHIQLQPRIQTRTIIRELIEYRKRAEETEENIRLLYVALTRAQKRMVIVDVLPNSTTHTLTPNLLFTTASFTHYLKAALNGNDPHVRFRQFDQFDRNTFEQLVPNTIYQEFPKAHQYVQQETLKASHTFAHNLTLDLQQHERLTRAMDKGTQLHRILEQMPLELWDQKALVNAFPTLSSQQISQLLNYNQHPFTQTLYKHEVYREYEFVVQYFHQPFHGIIDFLAVDGQSIILVDFKSDQQVTAEDLIARHTAQIERYIAALALIFPDKTCIPYLYSFYLSDYIPVPTGKGETYHG